MWLQTIRPHQGGALCCLHSPAEGDPACFPSEDIINTCPVLSVKFGARLLGQSCIAGANLTRSGRIILLPFSYLVNHFCIYIHDGCSLSCLLLIISWKGSDISNILAS